MAAPADLDEFPLDDDLSFESVLQQQTEIKENLDDLSDFDLDLDLGAQPSPAMLAEDDFLLDLDEGVKDFPVAETPAVPEVALDDLELPADFDLSLADELDARRMRSRQSWMMSTPSWRACPTASASRPLPKLMPRWMSDDDFDFLSGTDEAATKLDLAQAYIDMGDSDGARDILNEVVSEGSAEQKSEAEEMLSRLA